MSDRSNKLVPYEIEVREDHLEVFEKLIKKEMKDVPDGDYLSCFVRTLIDKKMIETSDPFYCFYENTEKICKILQLIPQIEEMKNKNEKEICIYPPERVLFIRDKIDNIYNSIFLENSSFLEHAKNRGFHGINLSKEVKIFIFLRIITNVEVYLEDRLKNTLKSDKTLLDNFIKSLGDDMPIRWRNGRKILPYDYYTKMNEIIFENALLFPYHEIDGRTNHIYRKAFGLDLMTYPKKENLIKLIKSRHTIIHRGYENISTEIDESLLEDLENYIKLSYDFIRWVEDNLAEYRISF